MADAAHNLILNADFSDGTSFPWKPSLPDWNLASAAVEAGAYCIQVNGTGDNPWDVQVRHHEIVLQKGHVYTVSLRIWSDKPTTARPKVGMAKPPYYEYWRGDVEIGTRPKTITGRFTMQHDDDPAAEFAVHLGGALAVAPLPFKVCIDDVILSDPEFTPAFGAAERPPPHVRVDQVGYLPGGSKLATLVNHATTPLKWKLVDPGGKVAMSGDTLVFGNDPMSGERLHVADFSAYDKPGDGYTVVVKNDVSYPFRIAPDIYERMKYDAVKYFYYNRSGIAIKMPYAVDPKWTRPAGHLTSDRAVPCGADTDCKYTLDVTGGWYDAGDYGKYVVTGGVAVWALLNMYERAKYVGASLAAVADRRFNIPESGNNVPDLLDEVRWEIEFLLKMQVPEGKPHAGMVHHKMHDIGWTGLGVSPAEAEQKMKRNLRPVSTAATLDLAAVGAMCARIWKDIDPGFADRCLSAAERAWQAAQANPGVFASAKDSNGGGPYHDEQVTDDCYWAAAELFITTGKDEYRGELTVHSPHLASFPMQAGGATGSITWARTDALGKLSLSSVPNTLGEGNVQKLRAQIVDAADQYLRMIDETGYRIPFKGTPDGKYPWGSNAFILNNMIVMAVAHDLTRKQKYFDGVTAGMGYLLGRNPLSQVYVTGYGVRPLRNPHHRFWSRQVDSRFPDAPPGAISGGPNSGIEDPYVQAAGLQGCAPQKCFVDHAEAWSTNEVAVNWNAPFAWLLFYLDEVAKKGGSIGPSQ